MKPPTFPQPSIKVVNRNSNHQGYQAHKQISTLIETQENQ